MNLTIGIVFIIVIICLLVGSILIIGIVISVYNGNKRPNIINWQNYDIPGFIMPKMPINTKTDNDCYQKCLTTDNCDWYNYDTVNEQCWLKNTIPKSGIDIGIKVPNFPYYILNNKDITGFDLPKMPLNISAIECQNQCNNRSDCFLYSYDNNKKQCWLKKPITKLGVNTGFNLK